MKKEENENAKTKKILSNKLSHRLLCIMEMSLPQLSKMKWLDHERHQQQIKELSDIGNKLSKTKDEKERLALAEEYQSKESSFSVPFTFGLYFPEHAEKQVAAFTKIQTPFISGMIKSEASVKDLEEMGIEIRNQAGNIFTANMPLGLIEKLVTMPAIDYIEIGRPNYHDLDEAIPYAQLDALHSATPSVTGKNVIVGIVDSHMDVYHVAFRNDDNFGGDELGSSRILYLWNQRLTPNYTESGPPIAPELPGFNPVRAASYGTEYTQENINDELNNYAPPGSPAPQPAYQLVRPTSTSSLIRRHGTHVAGCAAGNRRSMNNGADTTDCVRGNGTVVGAAPKADIIYVELKKLEKMEDYITADHATLSDAFAYIFARATARNQPCVINRSGSDNMGPHDGTTLGEQFLDNLLLSPGRAITFSAGNTDDQNSHIQGTVPNGGNTTINLKYGSFTTPDGPENYAHGGSKNDEIEIWYDGHDTFNVTLTIPDVAGTVIGPIAPGTESAVITLANKNTVQIVHGLNDPRNNDNVITIFIANVSKAAPIVAGNWAIQLSGINVINGNFAAWVDRNNRRRREWNEPTVGNMTIATPATSLRSIAVGAHDGAKDANGRLQPEAEVFTSAGPTRDGRVKPDISANGLRIAAAASTDKNALANNDLTFQLSGTSMAAPIVAGACACLFECKGSSLNWFDLKQILWDTAGSPSQGIPSNKFGFGYLQMGAACVTPVTDVDVWLKGHSEDTGDEPFVGEPNWVSPDIEIQSLGGEPVANPTHNPTNLINNLVKVIVRNRGNQTARNVQVFLHWADPATNLPYPAAWQSTGIYTGDPNWVIESNIIVIPELAARATTSVTFGWAPPAPGSNIKRDDHFCLLVRIETEADPSNINAGGWGVIRGSNNIALRNTHVVEAPDGDNDAETSFYVIGTDDIDGLWIDTENLEAEIFYAMPVQALVYRDANLISKYGKRPIFGQECGVDPLREMKRALKGEDIEMRTGITGADYLEIADGIVRIRKSSKARLFIPVLNLAKYTKMPVNLKARKVKLAKEKGYVHVGQYTGGRRASGVSLEIWEKISRESNYRSYKKEGKLIIEKLSCTSV